ncbi:MAG: glycosyltransferase, partial [Eubacterium sp.]|nr:glycosyltransferase [Eubacterium sp.]
FENEDDFINKISYFLSHEKHRQQVTSNCLGKMKESHTFCHRAHSILDILF